MTRCQWANCRQPATCTVDDWAFCPAHETEHHDLKEHGHLRGQLPRNLLTGKPGNKNYIPNAHLSRLELLYALEHEAKRPIPRPKNRPIRATPAERKVAS